MARTGNPNMITPQEAAKLMGCGGETIMYALRTDQFPVGIAIRNEENGRWTYLIPRKAFMDWLDNYHRTLPLRLFNRWKMPDGTYIIPDDELRKALINRAEISEADKQKEAPA